MRRGKGFIEAMALGVALGVTSSLTNASTVPAARFAGILLNSGWVWAAVAVAGGWRLGTRGRGAAAGVLALLATTTAYYAVDSILRQEPFALYWSEMRVWWIASVGVGSALGVVGASMRHPGLTGLLSRLVVPVGAAVEMVWLPRWGNAAEPDPVLQWVRIAVWAAATLCAIALTRAALGPRPDQALRDSGS